MLVTAAATGKGTHTGMSTLPGSPKQCSTVLQVGEVGLLTYVLWPYSCILGQGCNMGGCIFCSFWQCLSLRVIAFLLCLYPLNQQRLEETYLNSKILTEFPEGNIRLTKLKSPTYTLPSGPEAKATGAKSLLLWAGPSQLAQATLRWCPFPMMVAMTGGCWEMNIFSPFPLCMIPRSKTKREKKKFTSQYSQQHFNFSLVVQSTMEVWPGRKDLEGETHRPRFCLAHSHNKQERDTLPQLAYLW